MKNAFGFKSFFLDLCLEHLESISYRKSTILLFYNEFVLKDVIYIFAYMIFKYNPLKIYYATDLYYVGL